VLRYVTTNEGKAREARTYLDCERLDYEYTEIQSASLEPIAARGAREAHAHAGEPVMVDDAGLFVDALEGFPLVGRDVAEHDRRGRGRGK
jgi:XTP/dITP diphosphohydrolase